MDDTDPYATAVRRLSSRFELELGADLVIGCCMTAWNELRRRGLHPDSRQVIELAGTRLSAVAEQRGLSRSLADSGPRTGRTAKTSGRTRTLPMPLRNAG